MGQEHMGVVDDSGTPVGFDGVVYQIYPRSFRDTSGDGVGDLAGVRAGLDHLAWLGVDAIWLSPIHPSPMADFGYDVADYCDVDPVFGALEDVDLLIAEAHARDIEVWLDWVPNHTSDQHPWFRASRSSRDDPKRDWYVWRDPAPDGGPPNNWVRHFAEDAPAWTYDEGTGQYYLHQFLPEQPDVNWADPDLRAAMHDVLRFWLDRGIDGFRADVVHLIGKDPAMPDDPEPWVGVPRAAFHHLPVTHEHLTGIRAVLDAYDPPRRMVGEINLIDPMEVASYVGADRLHLAFHFGLLYVPWEADRLRATIREVDAAFAAVGAAPAWALGNHDNPRVRNRTGDEEGARAAALLLLTLRGTPFLYAGDELGLEDAEVPPEREVDPGGRDGCRAPIPWTDGPGHGWAGQPWLPWPPRPGERAVTRQTEDDASIAHLHRRLLRARRQSPALRHGDLEVLDLHPDIVAYRRRHGEDRRLVVVSTAAQPVTVSPPGEWQVEVASGRREQRERFDGTIAGREAVLLRPADPV
jgi:alpha-glucosidase